MKTIKLTKAELEAAIYCVGNFEAGDVQDCGGSRARYNAIRRVFVKMVEEYNAKPKGRLLKQ